MKYITIRRNNKALKSFNNATDLNLNRNVKGPSAERNKFRPFWSVMESWKLNHANMPM